jgi:hypothetical protein
MKTVFKIKCPYCGSPSFRYNNGQKQMFLCHDCQRNQSWSFVAPRFEKANEGTHSVSIDINYSSLLSLCDKVSELPDNHIAKQYVISRSIPESLWDTLYYTDQMSQLAQTTEHELADGQPKLIIPFFNENKRLFGLQARALDNAKPKYITLMYDKNEKKIYGLDRVDVEKPIICVEGPIDAMFLKNAIAMAGSDGLDNKYKTKTIIAFDNEPRSKQTVGKMKKYLDNGYNIVIWPDKIKAKDVNDMILSGIDVEPIIYENVYSGLPGKIKLNSWKRV